MISDFHMHSCFSGDSEVPPREMIEQAILLGLQSICFTDHYDRDFPGEDIFTFDIPSYFQSLCELKTLYKNQIKILIGIELGLQPHLKDFHNSLVEEYPFDFIIGSSHVVDGIDPYYPAFYENRSEHEAYEAYFQSIIDNLNAFSAIDVYGHIDYCVRYGPNKADNYSYAQYREILDEILKKCICHNVGIELNTGGFADGLDFPHPHPDIIKRYRELGGEIITIGSDGHDTAHLAYRFQQIPELLKECGFRYYTVFENHKPEFIKL